MWWKYIVLAEARASLCGSMCWYTEAGELFGNRWKSVRKLVEIGGGCGCGSRWKLKPIGGSRYGNSWKSMEVGRGPWMKYTASGSRLKSVEAAGCL